MDPRANNKIDHSLPKVGCPHLVFDKRNKISADALTSLRFSKLPCLTSNSKNDSDDESQNSFSALPNIRGQNSISSRYSSRRASAYSVTSNSESESDISERFQQSTLSLPPVSQSRCSSASLSSTSLQSLTSDSDSDPDQDSDSDITPRESKNARSVLPKVSHQSHSSSTSPRSTTSDSESVEGDSTPKSFSELLGQTKEDELLKEDKLLEATSFSKNDRDRLINSILLYLNFICLENGGLGVLKNKEDSKVDNDFFMTREIPIDLFLHTAAKASKTSEQSLICMLIILKRYCPTEDINYSNVAYLIITSLIIAAKLCNDQILNDEGEYRNFMNSDYTDYLLDVPEKDRLKKLNRMERIMMDGMDYNLFITSQDYNNTVNILDTIDIVTSKSFKFFKPNKRDHEVCLLPGGMVEKLYQP